jgi:aspartyl/asparaginyl beta-hydroxylase (cupin superfamily)
MTSFQALVTPPKDQQGKQHMKSTPRPWFAEEGTAFTGTEPFFFNPGDFPWTRKVEENWQTIRDELYALLAADESNLEPYANVAMTSRPNQWKTFGMMFWTIKKESHVQKCPKTWALLKDVPNICAISFNLLEPNTTIKPHHGDTNAIIRCHMGLEVPASAPRCAFRVGTETVSWNEGKFLMFCDAYEHTAWNNSDRRRYILVVDIMRPEYVEQKRSVACRVLASIKLAIYYQRHAWLRRHFGGARGRALALRILRFLTYLPLRRAGT